MSNLTKGLLGFLFVMVVGLTIVATSGQSDEEQATNATLRTSSMLHQYAADKCKLAIKKNYDGFIYAPTSSDSDQESWVTMKWVGEQGKLSADCKYIKLKGVVSLVINGKTVIATE